MLLFLKSAWRGVDDPAPRHGGLTLCYVSDEPYFATSVPPTPFDAINGVIHPLKALGTLGVGAMVYFRSYRQPVDAENKSCGKADNHWFVGLRDRSSHSRIHSTTHTLRKPSTRTQV